MTAHMYLSQLQSIDTRIEDKLCEARKWHDLATSTSANIDSERVKSSSSQQRMADAATQAAFYEMQAMNTARQFSEKRKEIIDLIESISDDRYYKIIYRYYVKGESIASISREIGYSRMHTNRLYNLALDEIEQKML